MVKFVFAISIIYLTLSTFAFVFSNKMAFPIPAPPGYEDIEEILKLRLDDGTLISAVYLQNPNAQYTLLFSHGNATDIGYLQELFQEYYNAGFSVFAYDYPGYGTSQGSPNEKNVYASIEKAYRYLTQNLNTLPSQIILYGQSIGSGPTVELATHFPVAGIILEAPFLSLYRTVTQFPILWGDKFDNINKITHINKTPILIIQGTKDRVIPSWHGRKLFEAAPEPKYKLWVKDAGHNDLLPTAGPSYWETLSAFTEKL